MVKFSGVNNDIPWHIVFNGRRHPFYGGTGVEPTTSHLPKASSVTYYGDSQLNKIMAIDRTPSLISRSKFKGFCGYMRRKENHRRSK